MMMRTYANNLTDARSYAGTETYSDHRLVVMKYEDNWTKLYKTANKKKDDKSKKINTQQLVNNEESRSLYQERLAEEMEEREVDTWEELSSLLQEVAVEVVGYNEPAQPKKVKDSELEKMSRKQRELHLEMMNEKDAEKLKEIRTERKKLAKEVKKKVKEVREKDGGGY